MNYYPFHIGDYLSATRHLSWEEDAAYRRLLDTYYTSERPLSLDLRAVCRLVLATNETQREAVQVVLAEFFEKTDFGWVNHRADAEILAMQEKQQKQRDRANKRWQKPGAEQNASPALPRHEQEYAAASIPDAVAMPPTPTPTPTPVFKEDSTPRRRATSSTRPDDVSESVWQDFLVIRKAKRAPMTDTAMDGLRREAEKAGITLDAAIAYCCEAGWQGFNAGWYADRVARQPAKSGPTETSYQRSMRERVAEFAPSIARQAPGATNVIDMETFDVPSIARN